MRSRVLAYLLPTACLLYGQQPAPPETNDLCRIEGRVVESVTGEPVRGVSLSLRALPPGTARRSEISDANGRFSFENVEPGSYALSTSQPTTPPVTRVTLSAGQVLKDMEVRVAARGSISGRVVDEQERPVPKVMVTCRESLLGSIATTDNDGGFRIQVLGSGSCLLGAVPRGGESATVEEPQLVTFYPSTTDEAAAIPLLVSSGQELSGITIILRRGLLYRVQGSVVTASPSLSPGDVRVILMPRSRESMFTIAGALLKRESGGGVTLPPDGSFDLGLVPPGSYYLRAERKDDSRLVLGRMFIDVRGEDLEGLVLVAREPLRLTGTVQTEGEGELDLSRVAVMLTPVEGVQPPSASSTLSAEDTFAMEDLPSDDYVVHVSGLPEGAYVKSIRLGGRETIDSGLELSGLETVPPIEVLVSSNGATVEGTVEDDDKPAPGAWVCLVPNPLRPESSNRIRSGMADTMGRFRLPGVTPGYYRLYAFEESQPNSLANLDFFKSFESKAARLTVDEGERKQVNLTVMETTEAK